MRHRGGNRKRKHNSDTPEGGTKTDDSDKTEGVDEKMDENGGAESTETEPMVEDTPPTNADSGKPDA